MKGCPFPLLLVAIPALIFFQAGTLLSETDCEPKIRCKYEWMPMGVPSCDTDEFWFEADSASGAQGDVLGVRFTLKAEPDFEFPLGGIDIAVCHDPSIAEVVGEPIFSEEILSRSPAQIAFFPIDHSLDPVNHTGYGFLGFFLAMRSRIPMAAEIPLMTVFYRLKGEPGSVSNLSFCSDSLEIFRSRCNPNRIADGATGMLELYPLHNQPGVLSVVDGLPTHPDRPPEPPEATIYPDPLSKEQVNFRVRISEAAALPGEHHIPVAVFVSADVDYTGIIVPVDFDERYLRLTRVQHHFIAGTVIINDGNEGESASSPRTGNAVLASAVRVGKRRIAPAGEEFHAATLYFDVLERAAEVRSTSLEVHRVWAENGVEWDPWVAIRVAENGVEVESPEIRQEVEPISIIRGVFAIRGLQAAVRGDVNLDGEFDVSDPVSVLNYLFQGADPLQCPKAGDYDGDGRLTIADPIGMLMVLFQRGQAAEDPVEVECR
jgi:hypothetical protein